MLGVGKNVPIATGNESEGLLALVDGKVESGVLPSGQVVGVIDDLPTVAELIQRIVGEAEAVLARLEGGA